MTDLYVYDSTDEIIQQSANAAGRDTHVDTQAVASFGEVLAALGRMIQENRRFANIYFDTHGSPGRVAFRNGALTADNAFQLQDHRGVLENPGRVLFMGCNVAEGDVGWRFLQAVGSSFVRNGFVGGSNATLSSGLSLNGELRMPRWGILKIVQMRDGFVTRRTEIGSLLARFVRWVSS